MRTKLFLDVKFTGRYEGELISICIASENEDVFYAEFEDYDKSQVDEWVEHNILPHISFPSGFYRVIDKSITLSTNKKDIVPKLKRWLSNFKEVEIWSDAPSYKWTSFCNLFGGVTNLPENVYHRAFDIATLFRSNDIDPDVNRIDFCGFQGPKYGIYSSFWNVLIMKGCYENLMQKELLLRMLEKYKG